VIIAILATAVTRSSVVGICCPVELVAGEPQQTLSSASPTNPAAKSLAASLERVSAEDPNEQVDSLVRKLLSIRGVGADTLLRVGVHLAQQGFYSEAAAAFSQCARDHPARFEAHYDLALAELALGRDRRALAHIEAAPRGTAVDEVARRYLRGKIEAALGETQPAGRDLAAAFSAEPQQEDYGLEFGLFCLRQRHYGQAARTFGRAIEFNPRSSYLLLGLSLAEFREGRDAECIQACQKLLALDPEFSPARLLLAFVLYIDGKLSKSEKIAAGGLENLRPDPYLYYVDVADLLKLHSTDYARMLSEIAAAEHGIPHCSLCLMAQSKIHQRQGKIQAAIAAAEEAVKIDPAYSDAWYRLALLYDRMGRTADAREARARFNALKTAKEAGENEMLKQVFMEALGGPEGAKPAAGNNVHH
jgi:tetratricopeptide (TPR) repeat protein